MNAIRTDPASLPLLERIRREHSPTPLTLKARLQVGPG